ncbi:hypothetical protein [Caballeronia humi]|uniref:Resolvase n=1 Tax=Caballeronia humi TaxID=326474 RepID=A0A158J2V1_9BURK|nr:hypothetical protein [Caballeronia humi]SAL62650.1 resolvase [Caballeronia humi]
MGARLVLSLYPEHTLNNQISKRTKDALAAAKARGVVLGKAGYANLKPNIEARQQAAVEFAASLARVIAGFRSANMTQRAMVAELNTLGIKTSRGKDWSLTQLQRTLDRLGGE